MQPADGFAFDSGSAVNGAHGQPPAGSRLSQYMGANRQAGPSFGSNLHLRINAPVFVPKHQQQQQQAMHQFSTMSVNEAPTFVPQLHLGRQVIGPPVSQSGVPIVPPPQIHAQSGSQSGSYGDLTHQPRFPHENRGGTTFFYSHQLGEHAIVPSGDAQQQQQQPQPQQPIDEHYDFEHELLHPNDNSIPVNTPGVFAFHTSLPVPHTGKFRPKGAAGNGQTQFMNPELKNELLTRQLAMYVKPDLLSYPDVPQQIEHLSNLVPLENVAVTNLSQTTYKASSIRDGVTYCIRRIHGFRVQPGKQTQPVETWKKLSHGNVVQMREIIVNCRAWDDTSLVFVYDYYPLAETLKAKHFDSRTGTFMDSMTGIKLTSSMSSPGPIGGGIAESTLWAYVIQISAALRMIHSNGLAARTIDLNKILVYSNKLLLAFCGMHDILNPDHQSIHQQQIEDLQAFGCVLVALATGRPHGSRRDLLLNSMNTIAQFYSSDMKNLISYLLSSPAANNRKSINDIMPMIGARFYNFMETMQQRNDVLEAEMCKELENGRLFRLLCKMNTVLERAEHNGDEMWSETGDRFMLKLFRDYVFHQVTDQGKPWLDMAHIVQVLNKLDAGTTERIEMVSRDGNTQIMVDYQQLKRCLEKSFRELLTTNVIPRH